MLGHLMIIDPALGSAVEEALGMVGEAERLTPARDPIDLDESPTLSLIKKAKPTLRGRKVGALITDGVDDGVLDALRSAVEKEGATFAIVAPKATGVKTAKRKRIAADHALSSGPSIFFDAVALLPSADGAALLVREAAAIDWVRDAFGHLKVIGTMEAAGPILEKAAVEEDDGVVDLAGRGGVKAFIDAAKRQRIWAREPTLRTPG